MSDDFESPATATGLKYETYKGALLLITVEKLETDIQTSFGPKDAIRGDVTVIDGEHAGEVTRDTLIFPRALIGQLRPNVGKKVLGRLGQGVAKPGQQPPWKLSDPTDADKALAWAVLAATPVSTVAAPAGDTPPF